MSEHKKKVVGKSSGIVIGDGKKHHHYHFNLHLKLVGITLASAVVIVAVVFGVAAVARHFSNTSTPKSSQPTKVKKQTAQQQATSLVLKDNDTEALAALDAQIAKTTSKSELAALYIQKSGIAYGAKDYENSLKFAQQAENNKASAQTAQSIADSAKALGDKSLAIQYYKLQLQRLQPIQNKSTADFINAEITALGGTV